MSASSVIQFPPRDKTEPLAYAPGVTPFNRTDPVHIRAWNTLFALGWSEQRRIDREGA